MSGKQANTKNPEDVMDQAELLAKARPLQGPVFDADNNFVEWSDDSSEEETQNQRDQAAGNDFMQMLNNPQPVQQIRRTMAAIYMPIRVNCLYG